MGWKIKKNDFPAILERLPVLMDETAAWAAQEVANEANAGAPSAENGAQFSGGSLSVSYYAVSRHWNGYEAALDAASEAAEGVGSDLLDDGAVAPKLTLTQTPGVARARAGSAVNYAYAVEHGFFLGRPGFYFGGKFYPVKAPGHMVPARPHFSKAVEKVRPKFYAQLRRDLRSVLTVKGPGGLSGRRRLSHSERMERDEAKFRDKSLRRDRTERRKWEREQARERNNVLRENLGKSGMARQVNAGGTNRNGKKYRETMSERNERLRNQFNDIKFDGNNRAGGF
jgi:hypothetical protein